MAQTPPPSLTAPPTAPSRSDPTNFRARGDAFLAWFATLYADLVAALANVYGNAVDAYNSAVAAVASAAAASVSAASAGASASAAAASAGGIPWVSGAVVNNGQRVIDPGNGQLYRRTGATGSGVTPPRDDYANYTRVFAEPETVTAESFYL